MRGLFEGCWQGPASLATLVGTRHGCTRALLKLLLAVWKGSAPGVQDGSQHVFPNLVVEVSPLTAEALPVVLPPWPVPHHSVCVGHGGDSPESSLLGAEDAPLWS